MTWLKPAAGSVPRAHIFQLASPSTGFDCYLEDGLLTYEVSWKAAEGTRMFYTIRIGLERKVVSLGRLVPDQWTAVVISHENEANESSLYVLPIKSILGRDWDG